MAPFAHTRARTRVAAAVALAAALSGCATLAKGTKDEFYVLSEPSGANVATSYGANCVTPCKLEVERKQEFTVAIDKPGYDAQSLEVKTQTIAPASATAPDVTADYLGRVVDHQDGAQVVHVPNPVNVKLVKTAPPQE